MRVLVTGADGFVGPHLCRLLESSGDAVFPFSGPQPSPPGSSPPGPPLDVRDAAALRDAVARTRPDAVVHLAGVSSVAFSHAEPGATFETNAVGTVNVCAALKEAGPKVRLLLVSSGEVYGPVAANQSASEDTPRVPTSPYAASKVAAEIAAQQFARSYGLDVVIARPFNHLGAGQAPSFAVPSFARQIVGAKKRGQPAVLSVGNLEPVRDFSHVDDVVSAYRTLLARGVAGETYNVCSGEGRSIRSVLDELIELAGVSVEVRVDPAKLRPVDVPRLVGNPARLRDLGWTPRRGVRRALEDVLASTAP
jgi:GDP-4-dehydro-6-deoxy-D-mannose reductase